MGSDAGAVDTERSTTLRSMTGFASADGAVEPWQFTMDLRGVNGRGLDLRLRVPDWVEGLEAEARKRLQSGIGRGSVTLSIRVTRGETVPDLRINGEALASALGTLSQIETAAREASVTLAPVTATDVAALRGVLDNSEEANEDSAPLKTALLAELDRLIAAFNADRHREGRALAEVLFRQVDEVERLQGLAISALGNRSEAQRAAMERNLAKLLDTTDMPDETRLAQELALIAVKTDVSEEIDRLATHVDGARGLLAASGPVGRKLDFLMQEFNREANTLCSKAQSTELTRIGLDLKTVIDQMREQVQNVE